MRLAVLLTILASLVAYASVSGAGLFGSGGGSALGIGSDGCLSAKTPSVVPLERSKVVALRGALERLSESLSPDGLTPHEAGVAEASAAWSDAEPGLEREPPEESPLPAGYEMRWWLPNMDHLVADAWIFKSRASAAEFLERAVETKCRTDATGSAVSYMPGARNLEWRNPLGYVQQDVFVQRGPRVYRVSVVRPGSDGPGSALKRRRAFLWINAIACELPEANCQKGVAPSVPTAA